MPVHVFRGDRLRSIREASGKPREAVALAIGRSVSTIAGYEAERLTPDAKMVAALAAELGVHPGDFFGETVAA
jgi:transcriptional regulator with XRE-family HTH domain